jgi:Putative adhesin
MPTFDTPQPITATVEIAAGSVRLVATDRTDTVVQVRPRDESRPHDVKAAEEVRVDFRSGTLAVASNRGFSFPRRGAVVVDVALPSGSRLQASVASASVTADGEYADCKLASASGDLTLESVRGKVKADTASGDVTVALAMDSASVSTASGDVFFRELTGDAKFRTASGSLNVGRLEGDLDAQTASGDVAVAAAVKGNISVQTSSGEVGVGIAEGTAAQLDLRTRSGAVRNNLKPSDGPADGDETLFVHARTGSGDVVVQRATGPAAA